MANPQKENGYTAIANELVEALARFRIPGEARQVLDLIFRKTYGFNKIEDRISLTQFMAGTGLKKSNVCRSIDKLVKMNIIIQSDNGDINKYRFNKDFSTWQPLSKQIPRGKALSEPITNIIQSDNQGVSEAIPTKVDITKVDTKDIRSEAHEFNKQLFKYNKELTGIDFKDTTFDRIRYPKLIRQKYKDIKLVENAMYWAWHQRRKSDGFYYWRDGRLTLAKIYHRILPDYIEKNRQSESTNKLNELKNKFQFKGM